MCLGELDGGETCSLTLTYILEAPVEEGKVRLSIPTTVAPRYALLPPQDIERITACSAQLTFHLTTVMRSQIVSVASPSHVMESSEAGVRVDGGCYITKTRYSGRVIDLDRDMVILVETEEPGRPQVMLE